MTEDPAVAFQQALGEAEVTIGHALEDDGELVATHLLPEVSKKAILRDLGGITAAFVGVAERYDDVRSLRVYSLRPDHRAVFSCRCKEEWADGLDAASADTSDYAEIAKRMMDSVQGPVPAEEIDSISDGAITPKLLDV